MKRIIFLFLASLSFINTSFAENKQHHWTYGEVKEWGETPEFEICKVGKEQSPINIVTKEVKKSDLPAIKTYYESSKAEILNNGHTIQINLAEGGSAQLRNDEYKLVQFHFHTPSEETINGKGYPMVAHLVHKNANGHLAVIALLIEEGKENSGLKNVFASLPAEEGKRNLAEQINVTDILPISLKYYGFKGSLTTPPCSEGVAWHVVKKPIQLSKNQISAFKKIFKNNSRPVQSLNGRVVEESK